MNEALVEQPVPMPEMMTGFGLKVIVGPVVGVGVGVGTAVGVGVGVGTGVGVGLGVGVGVGLGVGVGVGLAVGVPVGAAVGLVVRKRALHESLLYQKARGRLIWLASQRTLRTRIPRARHGT